ncbi:MAG TPA: HAMP domain-containing sensor histidine kinase [Anaerolineales bacterium]|nr:HAMP domain-containing sensor histidine kinase [Anaerolineales bacterium]
MIRKRSVRFYLALSHSLFVFLVIGVAAYIWFSQQEQTAERVLRNQLKERARLLATLIDVNEFSSYGLRLPASYASVEGNVRVVLLTPELQVRNLSDRALTPDQVEVTVDMGARALKGEALTREVYSEDRSSEIIYAAAPLYDPEGRVVGAVCLILPLGEFEASMINTRSEVLLIVAGLSLVSLVLGLGVAVFLTRPLTQAKRFAARVAGGDYSLRLPEEGPRELAELAGHLNRMAGELEKQTDARRMVMANVAHELARPLGGLKLGVESLQAGAISEPDLAEDLLHEMGRTIDGMAALTDDLSQASRPITQPVRLRKTPVEVEPFMADLRSRFSIRAETRGVHIASDLPPVLPTITADDHRLMQIMSNLIDNAIKYTPTGGSVTLSARAHDGHVHMEVRDTGPGIPPEELSHLFEPFFRGGSSIRDSQGTGLGLAVARQLAEAHSGRLELTNHPDGGVLARLTLPLA